MATIRIQFQLDGQEPKPANVPPNCTLNNFEKILEGVFGNTYWKYSFICHGKTFDLTDENEFDQMKALMVPGITLFASMRTKGSGMNAMGSKFVDVTNEGALKRIEWGTTAPAWRVVQPGICLEGKCINGKCAAHKQMVIVNIGIKRFDLNVEKGKLSKCPMCQSYVNPITCAFNRCQWRYEGQIQHSDADEPIPVSTEWRKADNAYHRFDSDAAESVNWIQLIFEAKAM